MRQVIASRKLTEFKSRRIRQEYPLSPLERRQSAVAAAPAGVAGEDKAEELFRTLMGEKVEPRREFIQKHALEVKEIDYHGA